MNILDTIDKIGEKEKMISKKDIISPIYHNNKIITRIDGLVMYLTIPYCEPGWYKFRPVSNKKARMVSSADIEDIHKYLGYFTKIRIISIFKEKNVYYGVPLKNNLMGLDISTPIPFYLSDDMVEDFSRCICRYDGANLWYDCLDPNEDLEKISYLRDSLKSLVVPANIHFKGLSIEEKIAYNIKYTLDVKVREELKKTKIQRDVEFSGAKFLSSNERSDHIQVTYEVDGEEFTSVVSKDPNHQILTAGICVSGGDSLFDLKSIVSVIRQAQRENKIHKTL